MGQAGSNSIDRSPVSHIEYVGLAIVLFVAIAARPLRLDASLWYDEIFTVVNFVRLPTLDLVGIYDSFNNHMLYSLAAQLCVALFGEHPWALRLPAVIFGIAAIVVQWLITRRLLGPWPALIAGALIALVVGVISLAKRDRMMTAIYVIHIPMAVILLSILSVRIWPRYFFVDIGFIILALVHGVFVLSAWIAPFIRIDRRWLTGTGVAAMLVVSVGLLARKYSYPKQDFIGAREYVLGEQQPLDAVVAVALAGYAYSRYYEPRWKVAESASELDRIRNGANAIWVYHSRKPAI